MKNEMQVRRFKWRRGEDTLKTRLGRASSARIALLGCSALISAVGATSAAHAQAASDQGATLTEIVVTAQKRQQNLQDVPIAVTAVTQETLQANRVTSVMDLSGLAPGLVTRTNPGSLGSPSFSMRGVFATASQPSSDRQVSTYLDGVYIGATRGSVFDLPDAERIEVLRGPQGTLFGRNATAGAISVVTRNPTGQFGVRQDLTVGNYSQFRSRTTVDLPAVGPFSAFVTYVHDERRGDTRNLGAGTTFDRTSPFSNIGRTSSPKWLGSRNFNNVFAAVRFDPGDNFSMTYKFDRSKGDNTPEARVPTAVNPNSLIGSMLAGVIAAQPAGGGKYGLVVLDPANKRLKAVNNAWSQPGYLTGYGHNLTTQWQLNDSLSLKNITAYRYSRVYGPSTVAGLSGLEFTAGAVAPYARFAAISSVAGFLNFPAATQAAIAGQIGAALTPLVGSYFAGYEGNSFGESFQESSETQVNYDSKMLTMTVGALWYHSKEINSGLPGMAPNFAFAPTPSLLPLGKVQEAVAKTTSYAVYAQGEVHLTPQLDVVLGSRLTKDTKQGSLKFGGTFIGDRNTAGSIQGAAFAPWIFKKTKPSFSAGVNYKVEDNILVYGKYSTAFLSGGAVGQFSFAPETVKSAEAGVKSDLLDRRLRINGAIWNATYNHSQSSQSGQNVGQPQLGVVVIDNGTLKAHGLELEVVAAPVQGMTVGGSLGYTTGKLTNPSAIVAQGNPYKLTGSPKWTGNLNGQYVTTPVYGEAVLVFRADANYQGKIRSIPNPLISTQIPVFAPYEFTPGYWLVNGRVALRGFKVGPAEAELALWSRNLFNVKNSVYPIAFGDFEHNSSFVLARTVGVDLNLKY
jgi:iron complex outermembrane receptor protein